MNNEKLPSIIAISGFWITTLVHISTGDLTGIFLYLSVAICVIISILVIGVDYIGKKIAEFCEAVRKSLHDVFLFFAIFVDIEYHFAFCVFHYFPQYADSIINENGLITLSWSQGLFVILLTALLYYIYRARYYNWCSIEIMISVLLAPAIYTTMKNSRGEGNTIDPNVAYVILILCICVCLLLMASKRGETGRFLEVFVFNSITVSRAVGFVQRAFRYSYINALRLFFIILFLQCVFFLIVRGVYHPADG